MTIPTGAAVEFFETRDLLGNGVASVANNAFSDGTSDLNAYTNTDNLVIASAVLEFTTAITGDAGSVINLYARLVDIGSAGTEDAEVPDANFPHTYLGSFPHNNPSTSEQAASIQISLPNAVTGQIYNFYIENKTGQTISAGWELTIGGKALGPKA